jgi:hypothetical protein
VDNFCYKYGGKDPGSARTGVPKKVSRLVFEHLGFKWVPTMKIGQGCKVHARSSELPSGTIVISVSRHVVAVKDGVFHDTFDATRGGRRCVYGYWVKPTSPSPVMI